MTKPVACPSCGSTALRIYAPGVYVRQNRDGTWTIAATFAEIRTDGESMASCGGCERQVWTDHLADPSRRES